MIYYLIDGNGFCYRAFHAIRDLRNSRGEPTNVVFGFCTMLRKLMDDFKPDGIAVCFDSKGPTFRHEKFADYKIHRKPMPDDLIAQMPVVKKLIAAHGVPIFEKQGFEADDILGTMACRITKQGHETIIVTGDKDMLQLVNDNVKVLNPQKDYLVYDAVEVEKKMGVKPTQVVDMLALMGDSSDGIPGVAGIGEKTAVQLIQQFGSVDGIYKNLAKIPQEARRKALEENKKDALLSHDLATIDCDMEMKFTLDDLKSRSPDVEALRALFKDLEFRTLLKALPAGEVVDVRPKDYRLITKQSEWEELLKKLSTVKEFALDFETTGLNAMLAEPVSISFSYAPHSAWFVLFDKHISGKSALKASDILASAKKVLESKKICKIGQNLKYEMTVLKRYGIRLDGPLFDTMLGSYILNSSKRNHNMTELAAEFLDETLIEIETLIGKGKDQITMAHADLDQLVRYGCQDSDVAFRLAQVIRKKVEEKGMTGLLSEIEVPLVEVLCDMEYAGIKIDKALLSKFNTELGGAIDRLVREIHKKAQCDFNLNSPKQLGDVLFNKLGLPVIRKTKTGYSTDVDVLTQLAEVHELPLLLLEYRELNKLKTTYVDTMPDMVNPKTGRIHSSFNQTVTETGRLSSNEPNLQNIPVRTEEGRKIRKAFIAEKGFALLSADYSQIELRVLAHFSKDPALKKAFIEGQDVHTYTASLVFGCPPNEVTPKMRETAKTVNFGVLYGMSPFGLSKSLKISQEAARDFIKSYFERYTKVKEFIDKTIEDCKKTGYVETLFKRRRYIPDIQTSDIRMRQYAERTAVNAPVQGTASDLIKIAMIQIHRHLREQESEARMVLQVHDDLVFEVPKGQVEELAATVKKYMEGAAQLEVPLVVALKTGVNWCDMEKLKLEPVKS